MQVVVSGFSGFSMQVGGRQALHGQMAFAAISGGVVALRPRVVAGVRAMHTAVLEVCISSIKEDVLSLALYFLNRSVFV